MEPGTIVGNRFEILGLAARGGMGAVHRARDSVTGAVVVRSRDGHGIALNAVLHAND